MRNNAANSKPARIALALALCLCLAGSCALTGCKDSDVIRRIVYSQDAEIVDEDATPIVNIVSPEDAEELDTPTDEEVLEENIVTKQDLVEYYESAGSGNSDGQAASTTYSANGSDSGSAEAQNNSKSSDSTSFDGMDGDDEAVAQGDGSQAEEDGDGTATGSGSTGSNDGEKMGTGTGEDKTSEGVSMDSQGEYEDLPTDVEEAAAYGEYAAALCMVAGADALCATSQEFIDDSAGLSAFSDAADADVVFAEDGHLSSGGAKKLVSLHDAGHCDAVIVADEGLLGSDLETIKNAGIDVVTASLTSLGNIQGTVKALGKLFSSATDGKSADTASEYADFCNSIISTYKGSAGQYTTYVSDWDAKAKWEVSSGNTVLAEGTGAAATKTGEASVVTECLDKVGVTNVPGTQAYSGMSGGLYWLSQFSKTVGTYTISGSSKYSGVGYSNKSSNPTRLFTVADPANPDGVLLGKTSYKTLIAEDVTVAAGIIDSRDSNGLYAPQASLPARISAKQGIGLYHDDYHYAFSYIGDGTTTGSDCYKVYTAPHGLCSSWTEGSVESILLVAWAAEKYNGSSGLESSVSSFYQKFYDVSLSSSEYRSMTESAGE